MKMTSTKKRILNDIPVTLAAATSLICASLAIPACGAEDDSDMSISQRYSGEELYAGIMFDVGPASGKVAATTQSAALDEVQRMSEQEFDASLRRAEALLEDMGMGAFAGGMRQLEGKRDDVLNTTDDVDSAEISALVISLIEAEDPEFFERFADRIQSGDHYLVAEAMAEAGNLTLEHSLALGLDTVAPADADRGFCIAAIVFIAFTYTLAGNVNVAVNINAVVDQNVTIDDQDSASKQLFNASSMRRDVFIDQITTAYAS